MSYDIGNSIDLSNFSIFFSDNLGGSSIIFLKSFNDDVAYIGVKNHIDCSIEWNKLKYETFYTTWGRSFIFYYPHFIFESSSQLSPTDSIVPNTTKYHIFSLYDNEDKIDMILYDRKNMMNIIYGIPGIQLYKNNKQ